MASTTWGPSLRFSGIRSDLSSLDIFRELFTFMEEVFKVMHRLLLADGIIPNTKKAIE
jgi:hypothetical protein